MPDWFLSELLWSISGRDLDEVGVPQAELARLIGISTMRIVPMVQGVSSVAMAYDLCAAKITPGGSNRWTRLRLDDPRLGDQECHYW